MFLVEDFVEVVAGDDAEELVLVVDDGNGFDVVLEGQVGDAFLVHLRVAEDDRGLHDLAGFGGWRFGEELSEGKDADQGVVFGEDVDVVDAF